MINEELSISDATLIARLRKYKDDLLSITADRIEQLVATNEVLVREMASGSFYKESDIDAMQDHIKQLKEAFGILEDALQEVGDDYPGSSLQEWCQQQIRFAHYALKGD